jgi:hypothetical protein
MPPLPNADTHPGQNGSDFLVDDVDDLLDGNGKAGGQRMGLFSNHNGEGNYGVEEFPVQKHVIHFLGERIDARNRMNVEICILMEAGTPVSNERFTTTDIQNRMMLDRYVNLVRQFDSDNFASSTLQDEMTIKLYNGKKDITGDRLWQKFEDWRKELRTKYTPKMPSNISSIPSGHQLRDVYKEFALDCYKVEHVSKVCRRCIDVLCSHKQSLFYVSRMIYVSAWMMMKSLHKCQLIIG